MKRALLFLLLVCSTPISACFYFAEIDEVIWEQSVFKSMGYSAFLHAPLYTFYKEESKANSRGSNLQEWQKLLPHWSLEDIGSLLDTEETRDFYIKKVSPLNQLDKSILNYLELAKDIAKEFQKKRHSWNYKPSQDPLKSIQKEILLGLAARRFEVEEKVHLKLRYAFQVLKCLHGSQSYEKGISFFEKEVLGHFEQSEIYFYALDRYAGCLYAVNDKDKAAKNFITVFANSIDRKKSAFTSYKFCLNKGFDGASRIETDDERLNYHALMALNEMSDEIEDLLAVYRINPDSELLRLLVSRQLYRLDHYRSRGILKEYKAVLKNLLSVTNERVNTASSKKSFWLICGSYAHFLDKDLSEAKSLLALLPNNHPFSEFTAKLSSIYEVSSWENHSSFDHNKIASWIPDSYPICEYESLYQSRSECIEPWKLYIAQNLDVICKKEDRLAYHYIMNFPIELIKNSCNFSTIDRIIELLEKDNKSPWEKKLLSNELYSLDYLYYSKGRMLLRDGRLAEARVCFNKSKLGTVKKPLSKRCFSNNTKECFECPVEEVLTDSVIFSRQYADIDSNFSYSQIITYVLSLETATREETNWRKPMAHYLLGNFYYNASPLGYYRNLFIGDNDWKHYRYYNKEVVCGSGQDTLDYLPLINSNDFCDKAFYNYQQVMKHSNDKELNARCLFMMAKCELNQLYRNDLGDEKSIIIEGAVTDKSRPYKTSFRQLKSEYDKTKFHRNIINECAFYRHFVEM